VSVLGAVRTDCSCSEESFFRQRCQKAARFGRKGCTKSKSAVDELKQIDEFLETGRIEESETILASSRYQALRTFSSVYTIGHSTAKDLYDRHHCRTLEDVRQHYQNISDESEEVRMKVRERRRREGGMLHVDIVEDWIKIKDDLDSK